MRGAFRSFLGRLRIELGPVTEESLVRLARWLARGAAVSFGVTFAEVMNLEAYSDRVVGFDARVQAVPYAARRDGDSGWLPDNVEAGIATVDRETGVVRNIPMSQQAIADLGDDVSREALEKGASG